MSPFEYVIVLVSIIIGLGITLVLTGIAQLIREERSVKLFGPYLIWVGLVFVMHIHEWWITYQLKATVAWKLPTFLFIILYPILLFILANLLFPDSWEKCNRDMKQFYFTIYPKFFGCAVALVILSVLQNIFISELAFMSQFIHLIILAVISVMLILKPKTVFAHTAVAVLLLSILIASLIIERNSLLIQ
ncbi:MAG TPA: hypothetical protein PK325_16255 [Cyclobacteriaceae bacterium]|nr:hypothetical protein [Cyclobacteriaceae bacterium]HMV10606.1 hypothetical protein [Cyclobacteriaceae bacterium]HMV89926.1 hypothetical protein [Cyclobacteriaceae bacterium]HMX02593.1 hypothetical protein [Cyclobacteriaceae bacterium]HMX50908.1 hypothetical protein [Cyclobacteriaceae bacterium]